MNFMATFVKLDRSMKRQHSAAEFGIEILYPGLAMTRQSWVTIESGSVVRAEVRGSKGSQSSGFSSS